MPTATFPKTFHGRVVSSVSDVLFGRKGNGLGIYLRMSGVVALGSLLVQVTHTESRWPRALDFMTDRGIEPSIS